MTKTTTPKISLDVSDLNLVAQMLQDLPVNTIDSVNWSNMYPSKPEVTFSIAHNGEHILLQYCVKENEILAAVKNDNGKVWTDSCVEMFISFDDEHYYNAEFSCIGKALLGYRKFGGEGQHASDEIMQTILRLPTLGTANIEKTAGYFEWILTLVIPCTAFWKSNIKSFDGLEIKANFYKCGDHLTTPHYLSWKPIDTPSPNFHQPSFFGILSFE